MFETIYKLLDSLFNTRVGRHAKVVVRAPHSDRLFSPRVLACLRKVFGIAEYSLEDAVRVVLLFLNDLLVKEVLVREEAYNKTLCVT